MSVCPANLVNRGLKNSPKPYPAVWNDKNKFLLYY